MCAHSCHAHLNSEEQLFSACILATFQGIVIAKVRAQLQSCRIRPRTVPSRSHSLKVCAYDVTVFLPSRTLGCRQVRHMTNAEVSARDATSFAQFEGTVRLPHDERLGFAQRLGPLRVLMLVVCVADPRLLYLCKSQRIATGLCKPAWLFDSILYASTSTDTSPRFTCNLLHDAPCGCSGPAVSVGAVLAAPPQQCLHIYQRNLYLYNIRLFCCPRPQRRMSRFLCTSRYVAPIHAVCVLSPVDTSSVSHVDSTGCPVNHPCAFHSTATTLHTDLL